MALNNGFYTPRANLDIPYCHFPILGETAKCVWTLPKSLTKQASRVL